MMRRRMMMQNRQEPVSWDYEWDWTSGERPQGLVSGTITDTGEGYVQYNGLGINFDSIGFADTDIELEIVAQVVSAGGTPTTPQFIVRSGEGEGFKVYANMSPGIVKYYSNLPGFAEVYEYDPREWHIITLGWKNGHGYFYVDNGKNFEGPGVTKNNFLPYTGLDDLGSETRYRSIKARRL